MIYFTVVTHSYLGLALTLRDSLFQNAKVSHENFRIFVLDLLSDESDGIFSVKNVMDDDVFEEMSFKYDITEFATAVKPVIFEYLLSKYSSVVYLDPDIYVFTEIFTKEYETDNLGKCVHLTPHFLSYSKSEFDYRRYLGSGSYNLGFCRFDRDVSSEKFILWWKAMCRDYCFRERDEHLFTDQKWFDLITSFVEANKISIIRDFGFNVAPWNQQERRIYYDSNELFVKIKNQDKIRVRFYHFSGYDYKNLENYDGSNSKFIIFDNHDLSKLLCFYADQLNLHNAKEYLKIPYKFSSFKSGASINVFHRRIYRELLESDTAISLEPYKGLFSRKLQGKQRSLGMHEPRDVALGKHKKSDKILELLFKVLLFVLGTSRYIMLLKYLRYKVRYEKQKFLIK